MVTDDRRPEPDASTSRGIGPRTGSTPASVWVYAVLSLLAFFWTLLPGDPHFPGPGMALLSFGLTLVLAVGIVRGNKPLWWIALLLECVTVISIIVFAWPPGPTVAVTVIFSILLVALLLAPSTRRHLNAGGFPRRRSSSR